MSSDGQLRIRYGSLIFTHSNQTDLKFPSLETFPDEALPSNVKQRDKFNNILNLINVNI